MNNDTNTPAALPTFASHAERLAYFSRMTPTTTMPDRPTDTSRNRQRGSRPTQKRRIIR